ncbi:MAG: DUF4292 domain-containing protein [Flavobacteriales bacterium]|nr:DUF4292 domain-containing protein [Flavobacteriales bacterium]
MKRIAIALLLPALVASACKGRRNIALDRELPVRSAEKVLERAWAQRHPPVRYYSAKADVDLTMPDQERSFKAHLRSVHDSALWVSVVPLLGIEAARALLTTDSLRIMDRINDQYFAGDTSDTRNRFGLVPELALLQRALNGEALALDSAERYRIDREAGLYVLTSREKRRFIRAAEDISPGDTLARDRDMRERRLERTLRKAEVKEAIVHRYHIDPDSFRVARVQLVNLVNDKTADLRYEERGGPEIQHLPTRIRITLSEPGRMVSAVISINRIDLEGPVQMSFRIPEKYEPMP